MDVSAILLLIGVTGVGILHTMVPDHWLPIALLARERGWTRTETAWVAARAGAGHVLTTLAFALLVWAIGSAAAARYGRVVDALASLALIAFGVWIAVAAWREFRSDDHHHHHHHDHDHEPHAGGHHHHGHDHHDHAGQASPTPWQRDRLYAPRRDVMVAERHVHWHSHERGPAHAHWHDHGADTVHAVPADAAAMPLHSHPHGVAGRTALLLVLGSSPMVEGIPAFFAASRFGFGWIATMAVAFAVSTIATYVALSVYSAAGLQRLNLGPLERHGEAASGLMIAAIGIIFGVLTLR
jgi:hypothetical protein